MIVKIADNPDGTDPETLEMVRKVLRKDRPHPIAAAAPAFFGVPANNVSQEIMDWWVRMMVDGCSLQVLSTLHRVFTEADFREELTHISIPVLLVHGDKDVSAPIETTARKTLPLISGSRLNVYEGAAHGLPVTHAERLNSDLAEFARS